MNQTYKPKYSTKAQALINAIQAASTITGVGVVATRLAYQQLRQDLSHAELRLFDVSEIAPGLVEITRR